MIKVLVDSYARPKPGELSCGDAVAVSSFGRYVVVGLVDGLGHGPEAAEAAECFVNVMRRPATDPAAVLVAADRALRGTRGAAATVLVVHCGTKVMRGAGVGNVSLRAQRGGVGGPPSPGILGRRPRRVRTFESDLQAGDRLLLHSDGLSSRFDVDELAEYSARSLVERHGHLHDDASCLKLEIARGDWDLQ